MAYLLTYDLLNSRARLFKIDIRSLNPVGLFQLQNRQLKSENI